MWCVHKAGISPHNPVTISAPAIKQLQYSTPPCLSVTYYTYWALKMGEYPPSANSKSHSTSCYPHPLHLPSGQKNITDSVWGNLKCIHYCQITLCILHAEFEIFDFLGKGIFIWLMATGPWTHCGAQTMSCSSWTLNVRTTTSINASLSCLLHLWALETFKQVASSPWHFFHSSIIS